MNRDFSSAITCLEGCVTVSVNADSAIAAAPLSVYMDTSVDAKGSVTLFLAEQQQDCSDLNFRQYPIFASPQVTPSISVTVLFNYVESVIPPRCRKARPVKFSDGEFKVCITSVSSTEAPVAIRSTGLNGEGAMFIADYRWWKQKLWTSCLMEECVPKQTLVPPPSEIDLRNDQYADLFCVHKETQTRAEQEKLIQEWVTRFLLIDGVLYQNTPEPCYEIMTFGLGKNHGGTSVFITDSSNHNSNECFNLLESDLFLQRATEIALEREDNQSLPFVAPGPLFEVLLPEAIQVASKAKTVAQNTGTNLKKQVMHVLELLLLNEHGETQAAWQQPSTRRERTNQGIELGLKLYASLKEECVVC